LNSGGVTSSGGVIGAGGTIGTGGTTASGGTTSAGGTVTTGGTTASGGTTSTGGTVTTGGTTATGGTANTGGTTAVGGLTGSGGSSGGAVGSGGSSATVACIGNVTDAFTTLAPYWVNQSTACGSVAASNGTLELERQGGCSNPPSSDQISALVNLDTSRWALCGDFDVTVNFSLLKFGIPSNSWHAAALRVCDPAGSPGDLFADNKAEGMTLEYFSSMYTPHERYNSYSTDALQPSMAATSDSRGKYRMTRVGAQVTAYYWSGGGWTQLQTATLHSTPWTIELYVAGVGAPLDDIVDFSGLTISSASTP
jgi:hypothetical protein